VTIIDRHDHVFSEKGCRVTLVRDLIDFHASREGPQGHETLHLAVVPQLVLDAVGMVHASLIKEVLQVVCGQPCLMLIAACGYHSALHVGAAACLFMLSSPFMTMVSRRRCLHLFLPPLVPSSAFWMVTSGDAPLLLLRTK
jgi:hypothetical protein